MITNDQFRAIAIVLKDRTEALYVTVLDIHNIVKSWVLNATDLALPVREDVKTAYGLYKLLSIAPIEIRDFLRELQTETELAPLGFIIGFEGITFPEGGSTL